MESSVDVAFSVMAVSFVLGVLWFAYHTVRIVRLYVREPPTSPIVNSPPTRRVDPALSHELTATVWSKLG